MDRVARALRALAMRVAWLAIVVLIGIGGAGIVTAGNPLPASGARPERTWAADEAATRRLDASTDALRALAADVERLGTMARLALTAVTQRDPDRLDAAMTEGSEVLDAIRAGTAAVRDTLRQVPGVGAGETTRLSPAVRDRYDELVGTLSVADALGGSWRAFTRGSADATRLTELLETQDTEAAAAAREGSEGRYQPALDRLALADAALVEAKTIRDRLANAADVGVLDVWLERNRTWNAALRELYTALQASNGESTTAVRAAFLRERQAFARLPDDTRPLVIIMADVAAGGLNQAVIAIEEARGSLEAALDSDLAAGGDAGDGTTQPTPPG